MNIRNGKTLIYQRFYKIKASSKKKTSCSKNRQSEKDTSESSTSKKKYKKWSQLINVDFPDL